MLHHHTSVRDHSEAGGFGPTGRRLVVNPQLHPGDPGAFPDGFLNDRRNVTGTPEDINHVDLSGDIAQRWLARLSENFGSAGADRDDSITPFLEITGNPVARPVFLWGEADDGDRLTLPQNPFDRFLCFPGHYPSRGYFFSLRDHISQIAISRSR